MATSPKSPLRPVSPTAGIVFLISLPLGLMIYVGITFLLALLAFRVVRVHGYHLALFNITRTYAVRSCQTVRKLPA